MDHVQHSEVHVTLKIRDSVRVFHGYEADVSHKALNIDLTFWALFLFFLLLAVGFLSASERACGNRSAMSSPLVALCGNLTG